MGIKNTIEEFHLERYFAKYEFSTKYLLSASDCETLSIKELLDLTEDPEHTLNQLLSLRMGYTESLGHPQLQLEIAKLYSTLSSENIIVFSGAEEGIFILMNVLLQKGDHIIVQYPCYQSLYSVAKSIGVEVTQWQMQEKDDWGLNLDTLENSIQRNTKLIIINFPHNPTGALISRNKQEKIVDIAKKHDLYLFSDEVYRLLEYQQSYRLPAISDIYSKGISLGVMSKAFGLAGLRIGWIGTTDRVLIQKLASFKDYTTICNSAPSEFLATVALQNRDKIVNQILDIINYNLDLLDLFFTKYDTFFSWVRPLAGSVAFPRILFDIDTEKFCQDLIEKKGVLLLPSGKFNYNNSHFRIGFGRKDMPEALRMLETYINEELING